MSGRNAKTLYERVAAMKAALDQMEGGFTSADRGQWSKAEEDFYEEVNDLHWAFANDEEHEIPLGEPR